MSNLINTQINPLAARFDLPQSEELYNVLTARPHPTLPSWTINYSTGLAVFNNVVVREIVYATAGQIGGITIASDAVRAGQTAFNTGAGDITGSNGNSSGALSGANITPWA